MTGTPRAPWTPRAGQRAPSARPECEQRRDYCQGSRPDHFCGTPQGKHTEASIEKNCETPQTDLIQPRAGVEGEGEIARVRFVSLSPPNKRSLCRGAPR